MNHSSKKVIAKKVHLVDAKSGKKDKRVDPKKVESKVETCVGTSTGVSIIGKNYLTKMKTCNKSHDQLHNYVSDANED